MRAAVAAFPRPAFSIFRSAPREQNRAAEPVQAAPADGPAHVRAELRAKRLGANSVRDDRYAATLPVSGRSPYELIAALAEACASIHELCVAEPGEERILLQISLSR